MSKPAGQPQVPPGVQAAPAQAPAPAAKQAAPRAPSPQLSGVLVGPKIPEPGLFAEGSLQEILIQMASDIEELEGDLPDPGMPFGYARGVINSIINAGASLALISGGKVTAVYAPLFTEQAVARGGKLAIPSDLAVALDPVGQIDTGGLVKVAPEVGAPYSEVLGTRLTTRYH